MNEQKIICRQTFLQVDISLATYRSSCLHLFHKIDVLENFAKFTGQLSFWSPFLNKFIKMEILTQVFFSNIFCEIFKGRALGDY